MPKPCIKYKIVKGDLLIAMSGATTYKIGIYKTDKELLLNQRVGKFEPKNSLDWFGFVIGLIERLFVFGFLFLVMVFLMNL
jgi:type I restriction enzyme S subunit